MDLTNLEVRLARVTDAFELAKLRYDFRSATGTAIENESLFLDRCSSWMKERLQNSLWRCWLAELNGTKVGTLWLHLIEKIPNPSAEPEFHAYITNCFIRELARGKGIGSRLLSTALAWCKNEGVHAVILWPTVESRSLYERHGFRVHSDLLELHVEEQ